MKKTTKAMLIALCAVLLVAGTVFTTLAYLTAKTEVVKNTFTVGDIELKLDEADVDLYGEPIEGADRVTGNEYKLIPGHNYTKDPTVTVLEDSEPCYVRMIVTISDYADVKAVLGVDETAGEFLPQNFVNGWDPAVWLTTGVIDVDEEANTATYEFRYYKSVDAREGDVVLEALFTDFTVPGLVNNDGIAALDEMQIDVVAHAVQADGFDNAPDAAWTAYGEQIAKDAN